MTLLARHVFLLLVSIVSLTTGLQTIHVGARVLNPNVLRPVKFKNGDGTPFEKDTPLGGHAHGLTDVINGPKSPLSLFGKTDDGHLKFKTLPKKKKKPTPSPSPTSILTPTPTPSPLPKPKEKLQKSEKKKRAGEKEVKTKKKAKTNSTKAKTKNNEEKKVVVKKKRTSTISDAELEQLKEAAIQRELRRHKEELQREKRAQARKKKRQLTKKKKKKTKKGNQWKVKLTPKKKKIKGGHDYKCTPGKNVCAKGFWCVGKKGDMVCRRPKAPYQSCRGMKDRCQIGSVCKKGICVVKYKKKTEIFEPEEASAFKSKTAGDILGH